MVASAQEDGGRRDPAPLASEPLHHVEQPHVGAFPQQQLDRRDLALAALPAVDLQVAVWPVREELAGVELRGMHPPSRSALWPLQDDVAGLAQCLQHLGCYPCRGRPVARVHLSAAGTVDSCLDHPLELDLVG